MLNAFINITQSLGLIDDCTDAIDGMEQQARKIGSINCKPLVLWRRADVAAARANQTERMRLLRAAHAGFIECSADAHPANVARLLTDRAQNE